MKKAIKLQVRKDLNNRQQKNAIKLKGSLISLGYTHIIHISDQDDEFHINFFETSMDFKNEVQEFINAFIEKESLENAIKILQ